jgi:hypothetical protein
MQYITEGRNMTDTKTLYDWANEAKLDFKDEDGYHDACQVWIDAWMQSPEDLQDYWLDWIIEDMGKAKLTLDYMGKAHDDSEYISSRRDSALTPVYACSLTQNLAFFGKGLYQIILTQMSAYVEERAEEWWADCVGYAGDMEAGAREDWEYENYRDRKLEERS